MSLQPIDTTRRGDIQAVYYLGKCSEYLRCGDLLTHLEELFGDEVIVPAIEEAVVNVSTWKTKKFASVFDFRLYRIVLYSLVREFSPEVFVETGVLHGMTSLFLLRALQLNGCGRLVSIDLPSHFETGPSNRDGYNATLPPNKDVGWMVPPDLRARWELHLGSSLEVLPSLVGKLDEIAMFCHDSEHTYPIVWFELNFAWERLDDRGIIICDNIEATSAFLDFCKKVNRQPLVLPAPDTQFSAVPRFGLLHNGAW